MKELMKEKNEMRKVEKANDSTMPGQGSLIAGVEQEEQKTPGGRQENSTILSPNTEKNKKTRNGGKAAAWDRSLLFL